MKFSCSSPSPFPSPKLMQSWNSEKNSGYTHLRFILGWGEGLDLCEQKTTQKCRSVLRLLSSIVLASLWIPPLLWIPLSLLLANKDVSNLPCGKEGGEMAGQVRRISQHSILFSNPPTFWEGVMWILGVVRSGRGAWVWHQLTGRRGCWVTGVCPIYEILILSLFCIIYYLDHSYF